MTQIQNIILDAVISTNGEKKTDFARQIITSLIIFEVYVLFSRNYLLSVWYAPSCPTARPTAVVAITNMTL